VVKTKVTADAVSGHTGQVHIKSWGFSWWSVWKNLFFWDMPSPHKVPSEHKKPTTQ